MNMRKAEIFTSRDAMRGPVMVHLLRSLLPYGVVILSVIAADALRASAADVELVSSSVTGAAGNAQSSGPGANQDGNVIAFFSDASNLVSADTNAVRDVFVRDRAGKKTERVSVSSTAAQANGPSQGNGSSPGISADGQVVAFYSDATNLVGNDTNGQPDVFVRNRATGTTQLVSQSGGAQGNGASVNPSISADGRFVAFQSQASNLIPNDTNNVADIFVTDLQSGTTERVCNSVQPNGFSLTPSISGDGRFVAFASAATNLVPDDKNGKLDVFVCDRSTGIVSRASIGASGEGNGDSILPAISADGTVVAFKSLANNITPNDTNGVVDVFARDLVAGRTERISVDLNGANADDFSFPPSISADGRFVAFGSSATNLVAGDTNLTSDVFVRDRKNGVTVLVDVNSNGQQANGGTPDIPPAISGDGQQIGFASFATNLSNADKNEVADIFAAINPFFGAGGCPDGTCPSGLVCSKDFCVTPSPTPSPTRTGTPTRSGTPTNTPTPTATFVPCVDDTMCPPDEHCRAGFCKKERPCDDHDVAMCFDRETCIDGLCECGGDCNLDGFVFVNEINKAVKILNNLLPVSSCTAADINGDGQVMGNEITEAVINLGQGCAQEPQPLVFAHDRGGMVTLTIGSAAATSGGSATVAIDLSGGQGEVATAQLDILFDPSVLQIADPGSACVKDSRLTQHVMSATLPSIPPAPAGLQRLRLFIGDLTPPVAAFADGPIATCTFQVAANAAANGMVLSADRLNVGDTHGDLFGSQAISGGLSIVVPTPTPAPAPPVRPFCPGDCDGDGEVLVNEVTLAVRIMAGEALLADCPAADADGDGRVFVTDITRAVISLGRGCPQ